jgi:hypothetical protein
MGSFRLIVALEKSDARASFSSAQSVRGRNPSMTRRERSFVAGVRLREAVYNVVNRRFVRCKRIVKSTPSSSNPGGQDYTSRYFPTP